MRRLLPVLALSAAMGAASPSAAALTSNQCRPESSDGGTHVDPRLCRAFGVFRRPRRQYDRVFEGVPGRLPGVGRIQRQASRKLPGSRRLGRRLVAVPAKDHVCYFQKAGATTLASCARTRAAVRDGIWNVTPCFVDQPPDTFGFAMLLPDRVRTAVLTTEGGQEHVLEVIRNRILAVLPRNEGSDTPRDIRWAGPPANTVAFRLPAEFATQPCGS